MGDRFRDLGLLLLRVGIGGMFMFHGWPKLAGGASSWKKLGASAMGKLGIDVAPTFFGFAAATSEFFGGLLIAVGFLFRPALTLLVVTMAVAASSHLLSGDSFGKASHAIEAGVLFLALILIGPGKHTIAGRLVKRATE